MSLTVWTPVLADGGFQAILTIIFVVVGILGWLMNMANANRRQGPRPARPPRPRDDRQLQHEIDQFLQDSGARPQPAERRAVFEDEPIEVVFEEPSPPPRTRQPLRSHLTDQTRLPHLQTTIPLKVGDHLGHEVNDSVREHLGSFVAASPLNVSRLPAAIDPREFITRLQNPDNVRQAILMNEILARPRSMR